ncbi:MAG: AgmX/PglI C-terminal domain-containing protein [Deltaproteobacteria bacterium]|nr:AgmX/PglI C-terminal domain-containing protein [Deltaproteobacteria bacterium]
MGVAVPRPSARSLEERLEVQVRWGASLLEAKAFVDPALVSLGEGAHPRGNGPLARPAPCDVSVPSRTLPTKVFPLCVREPGEDRPALVLHKSFTGRWVHANGAVETLHQITRRVASPGPLPETWRVPIDPGAVVTIEHGELTLLVRLIGREHLEAPPLLSRAGGAWTNTVALALVAHTLLILSFWATPRREPPARHAPRLLPEARALTPPGQKRRPATDLLRELQSPPLGLEGLAGTRAASSHMQRATEVADDRARAAETLSRLFEPLARRRPMILGPGGLGGELEGALGRLHPAEIGDAAGTRGLGVRGRHESGGGPILATVGIGALDWQPEDRPLPPLEHRSRQDAPEPSPAPEGLIDALDRPTVARVVDDHKVQIRYCYEIALLRSRTLTGRISLAWVVTAAGTVRSAAIESSTLRDPALERCILQKVESWRFPEPAGGGEVFVRYPFLLRPAPSKE